MEWNRATCPRATHLQIELEPSSTMAIFLLIFILTLFFETPFADPAPSFSFANFGNDSGFVSDIALFGDAEVVNGGPSLRLTIGAKSSAGRVLYKKPIKLVDGEGSPKRKVSFSTYFSFSISPEDGDGLAFTLLPVNFPVDVFDGSSFGLSPGLWDSKFKFFAVEFDTLKESRSSDVNGNHVGIDVGNTLVSVKLENASSLNLALNGGETLHSWIDYEAGSNRLEVRLSKSGKRRPANPFLSHYPIDLSEVWKDGEVLVGFSSSSSNSSQTCSLYSWSFNLRIVPHWLHSQPYLPESFSERVDPGMERKRSNCFMRFLAALIFGTGCGALIAFFVLFVWTVFGSRRRPVVVMPEEFAAVCPKEFEYKKIKVVVEKEAMRDAEK